MYTFVPNTSFGQLLDISPKNFLFLKTFYSEFSYIEVWLTDQISKLLEIEGKLSITLVINESVKYKKCVKTAVEKRQKQNIYIYIYIYTHISQLA